jgi:dihydropyrimidinase
MRTLIKNGTLVTATDTYKADLLVEDEKIALVGANLAAVVDRIDSTIDASGKYVIPGGIDAHTHFDLPFGGGNSVDDFESGTIAAAFGGTTCVIDFAVQPMGGTLREGLYTWHQKAEGKAVIDYAFHMIAREIFPRTLIEMDSLIKDEGVSSFKLFTAYPGVFMVDDGQIFRAMMRTADNGGLICMHAENGGAIDVLVEKALAEGKISPKYHALTRPPRLEGEATHRVLALAEVAGVPVYIVHLSANEALEQVRAARDRGVHAFAETCPQYLFLSTDNYDEPDFGGAKYVMSPPLRSRENQEKLWQGLKTDELQLIATDHCPFCMKEKRLGESDFSKIPNGAPGTEQRMMLTYDGGVRTGRISLNRWVQLMSTAPAKIFGLYPRKGTLAIGADADIVVWDPEKKTTFSAATHHSKCDYETYEGRTVTGGPLLVMSRGKVVVAGDKLIAKPGQGRFQKRGELQASARDW